MLIVLDTGALVAGLLNPHGAPGRTLALVIARDVRLVFDDRILSEYVEVLERPTFEFDGRRFQAVLDFFQLAGRQVSASPLSGEDIPDLDDLPFAEVAVAAEVTALVTGNREHFAFLDQTDVSVLSPRQFIDQWPNPAS